MSLIPKDLLSAAKKKIESAKDEFDRLDGTETAREINKDLKRGDSKPATKEKPSKSAGMFDDASQSESGEEDDGGYLTMSDEYLDSISPQSETDQPVYDMFDGPARDMIKEKKQIPRDISFKDFSLIVLLWGDEGTGKSQQVMSFPRPMLIIDLENRLMPLALKNKFPFDSIVSPVTYGNMFDIDGVRTLGNVRKLLDKVMIRGEREDIKTIALDGIADIRPFAIKEWLVDKARKGKRRQRPNTLGDWGEVNEKVREICHRLINWGRKKNKNVVFTTQVGYDDSGNREVPEAKKWILHNVDHKFHMVARDGEFLAYCEKSWHDPFFWVKIGKDDSIADMLRDTSYLHDKIEEYEESLNQTSEDMFE